MTARALREARRQRSWTQAEVARRVGVSQGYVCLLEKGERPVPHRLARKLARVLELSPTALPLSPTTGPLRPDVATRALGTLGYPGFAHRRQRRVLNPAELLLRALREDELDARVVEGLAWLVLTYADLDWEWVVRRAKVDDLQNRLGFLVSIARQLANWRGKGEMAARLAAPERALEQSRLQRESAFRASMTDAERRWLRAHRPREAARWNLLTNLGARALADVL